MNGAIISPCQTFRYRLWRYWRPGGRPLIFVMLNPSTADGSEDDPTIRKCIGFAKRLGFEGIEVANLFAYRATDPGNLRWAQYPVGPDNDAAIAAMGAVSVERGTPVVCAWGANARRTPGRVSEVLALLRARTVDIKALRIMPDGTPSHPLMLPYSCDLLDYGS
nr:DUF1643 domain-containing protein [uncultured Roseateles sp.]